MAFSEKTILVDEYGFDVENTPLNEMRVAQAVKLAGATYESSSIDTNFWTATQTGTGAGSSQGSGFLTVQSGTTTTGVASFISTRRAAYNGGSCNRYRAQITLPDTGNANNIRRWGCSDGTTQAGTFNNGVFFELNGTTIQGKVRTNATGSAVDTIIAFSGFTLNTNMNTYEIYYTNKSVYFSINGNLVGTYSVANNNWSVTKNFYIITESLNLAGTTSYLLQAAVQTIVRLGERSSEPIYKYINAAGTYTLKNAQGKIHSIVINGTGGGNTVVSVVDSPSGGATPVMATLTFPNGSTPLAIPFNTNGLSFYTGLTIIVTGTGQVTVMYE